MGLKSLIPHSIILQINGNKLSRTTKSNILSNTKMIAAKGKRTGDKKRSTNVRSSSVTATSKANKERATKINVEVKELQLFSSAPARGGSVSFTDIGGNANVSEALNGAAAVTQIFYHNGDPI